MNTTMPTIGVISGGGTELVEKGYYYNTVDTYAITNNVATHPDTTAGMILANITDLGYTQVVCTSTKNASSAYMYQPCIWKKDGTIVRASESGGTAPRTFSIPSDATYILIYDGKAQNNTINLTATFS